MQEIELKILEIDKEALIKKLESKGAAKTFEGLMKVAYFDHADNRIKKSDELLRLRDIGNSKVEITYKSNPRIINGCKVFDEDEAISENFDTLSSIFEHAGLNKTMYYEKYRIQYEYNGIKFEIDEFPKIPVFVEIEAVNTEKIYEIIEEFGLQNYEQSNLAATKLFETKYTNVTLNGLHF